MRYVWAYDILPISYDDSLRSYGGLLLVLLMHIVLLLLLLFRLLWLMLR